jgi:hypothetical protein
VRSHPFRKRWIFNIYNFEVYVVYCVSFEMDFLFAVYVCTRVFMERNPDVKRKCALFFACACVQLLVVSNTG